MKRFLGIVIIFLATVFIVDAGVKVRQVNPVNVHVIAIGVDQYPKAFNSFVNRANDASAITGKILKDKTPRIYLPSGSTSTRGKGNRVVFKDSLEKSNVYVHKLLNEEATVQNIKNAFKEVIKKSTSNDYFVFFFAGYSFEIGPSAEETILIPFIDLDLDVKITEYDKYNHIKLKELASFMNQIAAKNQLIISEAGQGKIFAENLQAALFESDAEIATNSERNRVILTTVDNGYDWSKCDKSHAPLTKYILDSGNMLDVFENYYDYEYRLNKQEVKCSIRDTRYYFISREVDYKKILARHLSNSSGTRGSQSRKVKPKEKEKGQSETYALIIATNVYNDDQTSWNDLKNPLNDANSIATILEQKYNAKIHKIYNEPKREIISGILKLKRQMDDNDKLLLFIAGHGHFSEDYSQGFLVSTDSQTLEDDPTLESYFSMAKLNSILDGFPSKQVFTVLDVCYGASFELNNADLPIENYSNTEIDNNLDDFISDVDKSYARIMLASGQYEVFDYWKDSQKHSPFASKLIKAFNNEKEFISPGKIFSYVRGNTTTPILKKFGKHEVTGDFLLKVY